MYVPYNLDEFSTLHFSNKTVLTSRFWKCHFSIDANGNVDQIVIKSWKLFKYLQLFMDEI